MSLQNIKKLQSERGFTLVELLIVIVIIAILAAITIVAYNGITARAHTSAAKQAAQNVSTKAEAYNAETPSGSNGYPTTLAALTGAATTASYYIAPTSVTLKAGTGTTANPLTSAPPSDNTVAFATCSDTKINVGVIASYWDFTQGSAQTVTAGTTSGSTANGAVTCNYSAT